MRLLLIGLLVMAVGNMGAYCGDSIDSVVIGGGKGPVVAPKR